MKKRIQTTDKLTERLILGGLALLAGLVIGWVVRGVASYNTATQAMTTYEDWRTACPAATLKEQNCEIVQEVLDGKTHSEIARVSITKDAGKPVFGVTLPLGVALEPGIGLIFGTDPVKVYQYRTCNTVGCVAVIPIDDKLQASLNAGKDGRILFAGLDNKPVAIPLSLKGYGAAAHEYRSSEARRGSWFWRMW